VVPQALHPLVREAGLVTSQRRASWVYCRAVPAALASLSDLLATTGASA
jgi:ArsR family transcriptional regulator